MAAKYYVVWRGWRPGIYESWDKCKVEVEGYRAAQFKSYRTEEEARAAYAAGPPVPGSVSSPSEGTTQKGEEEEGKETSHTPALGYTRETKEILRRICGPGHDMPPEERR